MQTNRNIFFKKIRDWNLSLYKKQVDNSAYVDLDTFYKEHKLLEDNWKEIREEIYNVIDNSGSIPKFHEVDDGQEYISNNYGNSKSFLSCTFNVNGRP